MSKPDDLLKIGFKPEKDIQVMVNGISIEDGSGENWLLELYVPGFELGSRRLEGYFNTSRREGWLRQQKQPKR